tara:strand:- start:40 stop:594 length:555 start_codon:yes stop_codon:yes gene_type:complete
MLKPHRLKELHALLLKLTSHKGMGTLLLSHYHADEWLDPCTTKLPPWSASLLARQAKEYIGCIGYIQESTERKVIFSKDGHSYEDDSDRIAAYTVQVDYHPLHDPDEYDTFLIQYAPEWYGGWRAIWMFTQPDALPYHSMWPCKSINLAWPEQEGGLTMDELLAWLSEGKEFTQPVTRLVEVSA